MLNKRWKEVLYALAPFGPNLIMIMMMAYYTDAVDPRLLGTDAYGIQSFSRAGAVIVAPILFGVLWTIGRIFDGFIDVPFASLTDRMKSKYARVKVPILIGTLPMIAGFAMTCIPIFGASGESGANLGNTIWFFVMSLIFFAAYTLTLIAFYGSLSTVCTNDGQRARVSGFKSVADTVVYSIAYAAVIPLLRVFNTNILTFMLVCSPLMLTIVIPLFLLRTKKTDAAAPEAQALRDDDGLKSVNIFRSIAYVFSNRAFWSWLIVNCVSFFGLQMFLAAQNALISGVMGLNAWWHQTVLNTAAFAPVPVMLYVLNRLNKRFGVRFAFQSALIAFAVGMSLFFAASEVFWRGNQIGALITGCIGGTIGGYGIGAFFMMPLMIPSQIASVEQKVLKRNNSAMFFAAQAVATSVIGALATGIVYSAIKGIYKNEITGVIRNLVESVDIEAAQAAGEIPLGGMLVPIIVIAACLAAVGLSFFMPKKYDAATIGKMFDKNYVHVPDAEAGAGFVPPADIPEISVE
ncbi:MAG: MFS transporter [Clostridiales bacterium]|jgi:Na+/melibiose symporter-like transporter|nr:MFS transporter [Clostridiales bacterium]